MINALYQNMSLEGTERDSSIIKSNYPENWFAFCYSDKHHDQKQPVEGKVHFTYTSLSWSISEESQSRNVESGTKAETMEHGGMLLIDLLSLLSYAIQDHLLRVALRVG